MCRAGSMDQRVHIEPVASVCHRDLHATAQCIRCNRVRKLKYRFTSVKQKKLAGRKGQLLRKECIRLDCLRCRRGRNHSR